MTSHSVTNPRQNVCKRVLGLEGDIIKVPWSSTNGPARTVKVCFFGHTCCGDGQLYSVLCCCSNLSVLEFVQVPKGHVWLQGDNTLNSTDSRHYGPVPYALLSAKAVAKVGA